jgi:hypothetical protein
MYAKAIRNAGAYDEESVDSGNEAGDDDLGEEEISPDHRNKQTSKLSIKEGDMHNLE